MNRHEINQHPTQEELSAILKRGQEMHDQAIADAVSRFFKRFNKMFTKSRFVHHHKAAGASA